MISSTQSHPVLVTGATGYIAGWVIKRLLDDGYTVHAAVRDPENEAKTSLLSNLACYAPGTIRFFKTDLLEPGSYAEAMAGCQVVFHIASPFLLKVKDPQRELVDPALLGTRNVLEEASRTGTVRRVVLTSSMAAIYGDNADLSKAKAGRFTEADWNTTSSLRHKPYSYSKTLAEREAWELFRNQDRWDLVVINPSLVLGPGVDPGSTSGSYEILQMLGDGTFRRGIPDQRMGVVDVRDVAEIHVKAAFSRHAEGRTIASGHDTSLMELVDLLRPAFRKTCPLPVRTLPKWAVWLIAPFFNSMMTRPLIARNVGLPFHADNRKSRNDLNMIYRPLQETVVQHFQQLVERGRVGR